MNSKELERNLATRLELSQKDISYLLHSFSSILGGHLAEQDSVTITGIGSFEVKKKLERIAIHPQTGNRLLIPPKLVLYFSPSKILKEKVKKIEKP